MSEPIFSALDGKVQVCYCDCEAGYYATDLCDYDPNSGHPHNCPSLEPDSSQRDYGTYSETYCCPDGTTISMSGPRDVCRDSDGNLVEDVALAICTYSSGECEFFIVG